MSVEPALVEGILVELRRLSRAIRAEIEQNEGMPPSSAGEVARWKDQFDEQIGVLKPFVERFAKKRTRTVNGLDWEDLCQESLQIIQRSVHDYQSANAIAWIRTIVRNKTIDLLRKASKNVTATAYDSQWLEDQVDRPAPEHLRRNEVRRSDAIKLQSQIAEYLRAVVPVPDQKLIALGALGLIRSNSPLQVEMPAWFPPALVEPANAIYRCNQLLYAWADYQCANEWDDGGDGSADGEVLAFENDRYEALLRRCRSNTAHSLSRNLWRTFEFSEIWTWALRFVPVADSEFEPDQPPDFESMKRLLLFDGWLGLPGAGVWHAWLECYGLRNSLELNFLTIFRYPVFESSDSQAPNKAKMAAIERWLGAHHPTRVFPKNTPSENVYELCRIGAESRSLVDFPLPFEGQKLDGLHHYESDSE